MYQPPHFREDRLSVQHDVIRAHPLGLLISVGADGPMANPIPFCLDPTAGPLGTLRCHLARANPQWRGLAGERVLVVFQGRDSYISPSWYATKRETGKVVPTWNYAVVQARGIARVIEDTAWLAELVETLTDRHEGNRPDPWAVTDAPAAYIASQLKGIVGVEIEIDAIDGKLKLSQNRPQADRAGVAAGLAGETAESEMAELVRRYGALD